MALKLLQQPADAATRDATSRRIEIRCGDCGYGAVVSRLPERCPMCGGATWDAEGELR